MIGRFLLGALTGGILVTAGMVLASALFPLRAPQPDMTVEEPGKTDPVAPEPVETASAEVAEESETSAEPAEPVTEESAVDPAIEETAVATETTSPAEEPAAEEEAPAAETAEETGGEGNTEGAAPVEPEAATLAQPDVSETAPAAPEAASASAESTSDATVGEVATPTVPEAPATLDPLSEEAPAEVATGETAPPPPQPTEATEAPAETAPETSTAAESATPPQPAAETSDAADTTTEVAEAAEDPVAEPLPEPEPAPEAAAQPEAEEQPEVLPEASPEMAAETEAGEGSTFESTPGFASVGTITERDAETEAGAEATETALPEDAPPIQRFAASFDNPEAKPVLSIILIDSGADDLDRAGLAALPFPVSFALDPMDPATPERAALYRAAGREVVMLATGIAEGSQASDIEVAFQSMSQNLPEAVAVMDLSDPLFQNNRPLASLVVPVIGGEGRGLLTWEKGLNAADQVARRDDIASAVIFRDLAMGGGDAAAAQRTLDRAVFKAGQDGRVVVAGLATPELVAALLEWSVEGRAGAVALGPVTAALKID